MVGAKVLLDTTTSTNYPLSGLSSDSRYTYTVEAVWDDSTTADSIEVPLDLAAWESGAGHQSNIQLQRVIGANQNVKLTFAPLTAPLSAGSLLLDNLDSDTSITITSSMLDYDSGTNTATLTVPELSQWRAAGWELPASD